MYGMNVGMNSRTMLGDLNASECSKMPAYVFKVMSTMQKLQLRLRSQCPNSRNKANFPTLQNSFTVF